MRWKTARKLFPTSRRDTLICIGILSLAMLLCSMLRFLSEGDVYAALIFETAVIFASRYTNGYLYGLVSSVIGVIGVNYMFTYPYFSLNFTISGYPLTFLVMITVAIIVGALFQPVAGYVFLLDGVLIGAGRGRYLAIAGIINLVVYAPLLWVIAHSPTLTARPSLALAMVWLAYPAVYTGTRALTHGLGARPL